MCVRSLHVLPGVVQFFFWLRPQSKDVCVSGTLGILNRLKANCVCVRDWIPASCLLAPGTLVTIKRILIRIIFQKNTSLGRYFSSERDTNYVMTLRWLNRYRQEPFAKWELKKKVNENKQITSCTHKHFTLRSSVQWPTSFCVAESVRKQWNDSMCYNYLRYPKISAQVRVKHTSLKRVKWLT